MNNKIIFYGLLISLFQITPIFACWAFLSSPKKTSPVQYTLETIVQGEKNRRIEEGHEVAKNITILSDHSADTRTKINAAQNVIEILQHQLDNDRFLNIRTIASKKGTIKMCRNFIHKLENRQHQQG